MNTKHETIIRPSGSMTAFNLREIAQYSDLLMLMIRRDFIARYKQTILGPAWAIIQPVATALVFTIVFGKVAKISTDAAPPFLFYLSGMLFWQLFATSLQSGGSQLQENGLLFSKVYFPRIIPSLGIQISQLIPFAIQLCILSLFCAWYYLSNEQVVFHFARLLMFIPLLLLVCAFSLGASIACSALTAKYRDLRHALGFIIQLGLYLSPVIYPISSVPESWRWLVWLNPMAGPVSASRWLFLGVGQFPTLPLLSSTLITIVLFYVAIRYFQHVQRNFVDTV